jgi:hypothetical protein
MADANNKTNMIEMTIITLPSRFCGNGSMGKLVSLVISLVNQHTKMSVAILTLPQNQASAQSGKHKVQPPKAYNF